MMTRLLGCVGLLAVATPAQAHLMPAGHGTLNRVGDKVYVVMSVPVAAFTEVEACQDGVLTPTELAAHGDALRAQVRSDVALGNTAGFDRILFDLETGPDHTGEDLILMAVATLSSPDGTVSLRTGLWVDDSPRLKVRGTISEGRRTLRSQVVSLTPEQPVGRFFGEPVARTSAGARAR